MTYDLTRDPGWTRIWNRTPSVEDAPICWWALDDAGRIVLCTDLSAERQHAAVRWCREVDAARA